MKLQRFALTESHHCKLPLIPLVERPSAVMVRGQGSYLWDEAGLRYLDFLQGWAVNSLGHSPPEVVEALTRQAQLLLTPSPALHNAPQLELAQRLCRLSGLDWATFSNSGTEAIETAIKISRKWGRIHRHGAHEILTACEAFHGRTLAAMAASNRPHWNQTFAPVTPGFRSVPFGDLSAMRRNVNDATVAILVEPVQGEAGAVTPADGYLWGLRELADESGILLVFDEVQTGLGRTGTLFAWQREKARPDLLTLGKGLGGGVPIGCVLVSDRAQAFEPGDHGGTFCGNPLCASAALAVLDAITEPGFLRGVGEISTYLSGGLQHLADQYGATVRGRGLLLGLVLATPSATAIRERCFANGLLINAARPNVLRFMPSLRVTRSEVDEMLGILRAAIEAETPKVAAS